MLLLIVKKNSFNSLKEFEYYWLTNSWIFFQTVKVQVKFHKKRTNGTVYLTRKRTTLPLCEDNWDVTKSKLACKSEGYPHGNVGPAYQSHHASFWQAKFSCTGLEDDLRKCNVTVFHTTTSCKHIATVSCRGILKSFANNRIYTVFKIGTQRGHWIIYNFFPSKIDKVKFV